MNLTTRYILFAVIATAANLVAQDITLRMYALDFQITLSMIVGTLVGLIVKYVLDKKYIFFYTTKNVQHNTKVFFTYCVMGLVTTIIFWGFEALFQFMFHDKFARYGGACLGLAIGYVAKYHLDKRFVFIKK